MDDEFSQEFTEATDDDRRAAHSEGDIANRFSIEHPHTRFCHDWDVGSSGPVRTGRSTGPHKCTT